MKAAKQPSRKREGASRGVQFLFCLLAVGGLLAGCLQFHVNDRIERIDRAAGYRPTAHIRKSTKNRANKNSDSFLVGLAFSGGGTRAAALSYGVLDELRRTEIVWEGKTRRLLRPVLSNFSNEY
jgi:NTE family protein